MKRGSTALVVLSALLFGVAGLIALDRRRPTTDETRRATEQLFPGLDPSRIDKITIEAKGATVTLQRRTGWWLADGSRADDSAVEAILSTLAFGQVERLVDASARATSGVDSPRVQLKASGPGLSIDLRIGVDAAGRGVYVARGADLLVAESRLYEVSGRGDFVSRAALLEDPSAATTLQAGPLAVERHAGGWRVIQPKPALADPERVGALLSALGRARAESISPGPAPSPGPGEMALVIDGRMQSRIRWSELQTPCGKLPQLVRADGVVLCFAADALEPLRVTVDQLREPHLSNLQLDSVTSFDLEIGDRRLSLRRANHAWRITAPAEEAAPADDAAVRERLSQILKLRARAFGAAGGEPVGRVHLGADGDEVDVTLARTPHELTCARAGEDQALLMPASALKWFDPDPLALRGRRVDTFRPDQVSGISGDGADLDRGDERVGRLLEALSDLHAESLQRRNILALHTIRVTAAGSPHVFALGQRDADGCLVRSGESGPAFVIAPAACEVLYAPFSPRPKK